MGANSSRNLGVDLSLGSIIAFLDDDDYWDPNRLYLFKIEFENDADVVYSDMYIFNSFSKRYIKRNESLSNTVDKLLQNNFLGGFSNVAFRKKNFFDCGRLDNELLSYQDLDLWIRLCNDAKVRYVNKPLTYYRVSNNSISLNEEKKLQGLNSILNKYNSLYKSKPECYEKRLNLEMCNYLKCGWFKSASKLYKMTDKKLNSTKYYFLGVLKYFATRLKRNGV